MSKIENLQRMLSDITHRINELTHLITEKSESIRMIETNLALLQENLQAEKIQLEEYQRSLQGAMEMKSETDGYFKQIEQNIDTLMTILTTSRT
jgi:chromosome segregation ATPase